MKKLFSVALLAIFCLAGCGGGSGSNGPTVVVSTLAFPLQSAYTALIRRGYSKNYVVDGTCSGSAIESALAATTAPLGVQFEGTQAALVADSRLTLLFADCTPIPSPVTLFSTSYWDSNFVPLGETVPGGDYSVFLTPPTFPESVRVGTSGILGRLNNYSNASKTVFTGHTDISFVIEPESADTAIVNLIAKDYDSSGIPTGTQQSRYRITNTGVLEPVSIDIQFSDQTRLRLQ